MERCMNRATMHGKRITTRRRCKERRTWMHPRAKSMARAELHTSAPRARLRTMLKPLKTLPDAITWQGVISRI